MAIQYERVHFRRRAVQFPRSYTESNDQGGGITHTPHPGDVGDPGVLPNEENMNRMDKGIADCVDAINGLDNATSTLQGNMVTANQNIGQNTQDIASINAFISRRDNPTEVTKEQVGLGNVPNVTTNNQTPTYSARGTDDALVSGETLAVAMSKLAHAVDRLYEHVADMDNPHETDIFDTFFKTFGLGLGKPDKVGKFTGNGSNAATITVNGVTGLRGQVIDLGFAPSYVAIIIPNGQVAELRGKSETEVIESAGGYSKFNTIELFLGYDVKGIAFIGPRLNYYHDSCGNQYRTAAPEDVLGQAHGGAVVYNNSFIVQSYGIYDMDTTLYMNFKDWVYTYLAWR